jgi:hypothetical protein
LSRLSRLQHLAAFHQEQPFSSSDAIQEMASVYRGRESEIALGICLDGFVSETETSRVHYQDAFWELPRVTWEPLHAQT